jgi:long-subunit acyl-CoA synthetase (AMP-forming)
VNERLARIEQVKRFTMPAHDLTVTAGNLTPTIKFMRQVETERHAAEIEGLCA